MTVTMNNKNEMRSLLVLMIFSQWVAASSQKDQCDNEQLPTYINCGDKKNIELYHDDNYNYKIIYDNECYTDEVEIECVCDECNSEPGATSEANSCNNSTTVVVLGTLVGLLLVLLTMVTTALVWTCWLLKIRRGLNSSVEHQARERRVNSDQTRSDNIENQITPCYNQPTLPVYESIPSHPKQDNKREGGEQGEDSYDILNREQLCTVMDSEIIHDEAKMFNYSKLELTDSKIKPEKNPAYATTTQSDV